MTLNDVIAISAAERNFTEFGIFGADYVKVVEDTPVPTAAEM